MLYKFYSKIGSGLKRKRKEKKEKGMNAKKIVKCFKRILHKLRIQFCTLNGSLQHRELFNEK